MDGEAVEQVAAPFQGLAVGFEEQACKVDDGAVRCMFAGDPLGIVESKVTGRGGNFQSGVEDLAWSGGSVNRDGDVGGIGGVAADIGYEKAKNRQNLGDFHSFETLDGCEVISKSRNDEL